jgi:hypothetical protein
MKKLKTHAAPELTAPSEVSSLSPPPPPTSSGWEVTMEEAPVIEPDSTPGVSKRTGKPKKRVSWAPAEKLEAIKEFVKEEVTTKQIACS